ncbi:MAG: gluconolactonase, partial [Verrucomicrobia bacterium]|nr:gluconolactonase [Verrucomicrobiota bacterium]
MRHIILSISMTALTLLGATCASLQAAETEYPFTPDSQIQPGVPQGRVEKRSWTSRIFPGTVRDYWVYVPAQYDGTKPVCVMVFQDGGGYVTTNGQWRVPVVFDNLIHQKAMPVTAGIFINPGVVPATSSNSLPRFNRSFEYDGLGDRYARFLLEEILPEVEKTVKLSSDPNDRAICGASSGAICAWTVAWERPDAFRRVYSTIGTFVGLRGGNDYPTLVRKTEPKPIRIFLQDGSNDLNIYGGSWWVANQDMLSALEFAGYDVSHEWGDGGHNGKHGGPILPKVLRWLWRDHPTPIAKPVNKRQPVMDVLVPGEEWQQVASGFKFTEGPAANESGELFFTDIPNSRIHKVGKEGSVSVFAENTGKANGLMFGPDGRLYACQAEKKRIAAYDAMGKEHAISEGIEGNDIAINHKGTLYVTEPSAKRVWMIQPSGEKRIVDEGIGRPNGVVLSPDQSLLLVSDTQGQFVYSFQIGPDGSLQHKQAYHHLHLADGRAESGADGMAVDVLGRLYVTTQAGLQFCDQAGRVNGIIPKPQNAWLSNVTFGGRDGSDLFVTCGDKVFRRKTNTRGVFS